VAKFKPLTNLLQTQQLHLRRHKGGVSERNVEIRILYRLIR